MTYKGSGDQITLEMNRENYERLLIMLGYALGSARETFGEGTFWLWVRFVNELNAGNPDFKPYEIPDDGR